MKTRNKLTLIVVLVFLVLYAGKVFADHYNYVVMGSSTPNPMVEQPLTIFVAADVSNGTNYWVAFSDWDNKNDPGWKFESCGTQRFCEKSWTVIPKTTLAKRYYGQAANTTSWQSAQQSPLIISAAAIKPSSTISADKTSAVVGDTVTITISATDDYGVKYISFWDSVVGRWERQDCAGNPKSCTKSRSFNLPFTGTANFYGGAGDIHDAWEWSSPKPLSVTVTQPDTTPPTGSITASPSTATPGQTITIAMSGSDNVGVDWLLWDDAYSGGTQWHWCGGALSCSKSWSFSPPTSGNYTFAGAVYDGNNNVTGVTSNTVTVSNAPAFSLSPNDFSYTYPNVNVREFSDRTYTVTNTGGGFLNGGISVLGVGFFCIDFCSNYSLSAGQSRSYTVRFSPGSGGAFSGSAAFTSAPGRTVSLSGTGIVVDAIPPISTINLPAAGSWQNDPSFSVSVSDSDTGGSGLSACYYHVHDSAVGWTQSWGTRACGSSQTITVGSASNCRTQGQNTCTVYAFAEDGAGNIGSSSTRSFSIDYTNPAGSITASPSFVVSGQTITVTMNGSDNTGVDRLFWNEDSQTHSCGGASPCTHSWSTTIFTPGNYTFSGRVYDVANNSTPVASGTVTVVDPVLKSPLPTTHWQRLWFTYPVSGDFTFGTFLREGPDELDIQFNRNWGTEIVEGLQNDELGFRSGRSINFPAAGNYRFTITSDDGVRLWIDDTLVIKEWHERGNGSGIYREDVALGAGYHNFIIEWYEGGGEAWISFDYGASSVQCTQSSQCTTPGKTICDTTANVCVSSVPPTSKIISMWPASGSIGYRTQGLAKHAGLRADNDGWSPTAYSFLVEDNDNDGNALTSNLSKCFVEINGVRRDRKPGKSLQENCNSVFTITVGRPGTGADCTVSGFDKCTIRVGAISNTAIESIRSIYFDPNSNEKDYFGKNFNEIKFDVDWEPPIIPSP